ncbi:MAG: hypothetical protein ACSHW1_16545 [Yoonia sp.]|uniref:hypothetical protein n=1 Tax=Yoonia sp. TaxID=2212373 RepID=UPI003EF69560
MAQELQDGAAQAATVTDAIDLHELTVIGIAHGATGQTAILRSSNGDYARVQPGDSAFGLTVRAIGEGQVIGTDRWGRDVQLPLMTG